MAAKLERLVLLGVLVVLTGASIFTPGSRFGESEDGLMFDQTNTYSSVDDAFEDNDDFTSATDISGDETTTISGLRQEDDDYYLVYVSDGDESLRVVLQYGGAVGDIDFQIYTSDQRLLATADASTSQEDLTWLLPRAGVYYVRVFGDNVSDVYSLWWDDLPREPDEYNNGAKVNAFDMTPHLGEWLCAINGAGRVASHDYFAVDVAVDSTLTVDIQIEPTRYSTVGVYFWNGVGYFNGYVFSANMTIKAALTPGRNYVEITNNMQINPDVLYDIKLVVGALSAPVLEHPSNGGVLGYQGYSFFDWKRGMFGQLIYNLWVDDEVGFPAPPLTEVETTNDWYEDFTSNPDGTYYWRVRNRINYLGSTWSAWSATFTFTVDTTPPEAPVLLSPSNGSIVTVNEQDLQWLEAPDARDYSVEISQTADFATRTQWIVNLTSVSTGTLPDGTWHWRVRVRDLANRWGPYATANFTVDSVPPGIPALSSPLNHAYTNDTTTTLSWQPVDGASLYHLQVSANQLFVGQAVNITTADLSYTTAPLGGSVYYWKVRARDAGGLWGSWSMAWDYVIDTVAPGTPTLNSPANLSLIAQDAVELKWYVMLYVNLYRVQVDDGSSFDTPLIDATQPTMSYYLQGLADGAYWWRVAARDLAGNWGAWTASRRFTVDTLPPPTPSLQAPLAGQFINDTTPAFQWSMTHGSALYRLQVDDSPGCTSPLVDIETTAQSFSEAELADGVYFWRVSSQDAAGNWAAWSTTRNFTIDTVPPGRVVLLSPTNASATSDATPLLEWASLLSSTQYWVQLSLEPSFLTPILNQTTPDNTTAVTTPLLEGYYHWHVRARDAAGNWGDWSETWSMTIDMTLLSPSSSFTANTTALFAGAHVQFTFTGSCGDLPCTFQWDFGDGTVNATVASPVHQYSVAGTYVVRLTVIDADGSTSSSSMTITVNEHDDGIGGFEITLLIIAAGMAMVAILRKITRRSAP